MMRKGRNAARGEKRPPVTKERAVAADSSSETLRRRGEVFGEPYVEGELEEGKDAQQHLERVQVEGEGPAVDEGGALLVKAEAQVEGRVDARFTGEGGFGVGGEAQDVVAHLLDARGACGFGEDGCGEVSGMGCEAVELDRAEEGSAGETEAAPDAGEDSRGVGDGLAVGHDANDVDLLRAPVGEGARGGVGVAVEVAVAG